MQIGKEVSTSCNQTASPLRPSFTQALLHAAEARTKQQEHVANISKSTRGIIFLGTPHQGSSQATWGAMLASMLGLVKQANVDIVKGLEKGAPALTEMQKRFCSLLANRQEEGQAIEITCCSEELPVPVLGVVRGLLQPNFEFCTDEFLQVVPNTSALLHGHTAISIHANHMEMARFGGDDSPGYVKILGELRRWIDRWVSEKPENAQQVFMPIGFSHQAT